LSHPIQETPVDVQSANQLGPRVAPKDGSLLWVEVRNIAVARRYISVFGIANIEFVLIICVPQNLMDS
jgi:hypothetical protein